MASVKIATLIIRVRPLNFTQFSIQIDPHLTPDCSQADQLSTEKPSKRVRRVLDLISHLLMAGYGGTGMAGSVSSA